MTRQRVCTIRLLSAAIPVIAVLAVLIVLAASGTAQNPVPFIDQPLVPDATAPGGPEFTLTVNGAGFVPASVVHWNGSPRVTTFVKDTVPRSPRTGPLPPRPTTSDSVEPVRVRPAELPVRVPRLLDKSTLSANAARGKAKDSRTKKIVRFMSRSS
jgi:hypothetical protein